MFFVVWNFAFHHTPEVELTCIGREMSETQFDNSRHLQKECLVKPKTIPSSRLFHVDLESLVPALTLSLADWRPCNLDRLKKRTKPFGAVGLPSTLLHKARQLDGKNL